MTAKKLSYIAVLIAGGAAAGWDGHYAGERMNAWSERLESRVECLILHSASASKRAEC